MASAQLKGPQNYQGDRLWDIAWMILPLINCTNCRVPFTSTDSADDGSLWSHSEHGQVRRWEWGLRETVSTDGALCQKLEGKDSTRSQAVVPWVTTDPIKKNINSRSQFFLKPSRENGGTPYGATSALNEAHSLEHWSCQGAWERESCGKIG